MVIPNSDEMLIVLDAYCAGVWFRDSDKYPASSFSVVSLAICGLILSKLTGTFSTPRWEHGLRETYLSEIKKKIHYINPPF